MYNNNFITFFEKKHIYKRMYYTMNNEFLF